MVGSTTEVNEEDNDMRREAEELVRVEAAARSEAARRREGGG